MKYSEAGFRPFYHQYVLFPVTAAGSAVSDYKHFNEADSIVTYGYIDHETGFRFEVLSTASIRNDKFQIFDDRPEEKRVFIKAEVINEVEGFAIKDRDGQYAANKELIDLITEGYEQNEEIMNSRMMSFLDESRDPFNIDDVQVQLHKEGNQIEVCWARIEGLEEHVIIGKLLNEPYQDFGYHEGDTIAFFVQKTEDDKIVCISDMNPTAYINREDLEGGQMLRDAIRRFNTERNENSLFDVVELLRDSNVWVPCTAVLSEADQSAMEQMVKDAGDDLSSIKGKVITSKEQIRMIPDILQNGDDFFFPVFSSAEEMGEYGNGFSKIEVDLLRAINLARNNEKKLKGIVVDAFSEPFVLDAELFDIVEKMKSRIKSNEQSH
ncbi:MAG: SseB family protein [Erysipelotrichaceae bacterium]|nr:SseB family protein [Erysipelotrichaceae bacterium]